MAKTLSTSGYATWSCVDLTGGPVCANIAGTTLADFLVTAELFGVTLRRITNYRLRQPPLALACSPKESLAR